jgi:hypothetical protein
VPDDTPRRTAAPALRPMGPVRTLATALELYRRHWRTLLAIVAVAVPLAVSLPSSKAVPLQGGQFHVIVHHRVVATAGSRTITVLGVLITIVALLGFAVVVGAVVRAAAAAVAGEDLGIGRSYRYGIGQAWPLLQVILMSGLLTALGFVLLVVPGIIVGVLLAVSVPALVVEGRRGRDALSRSWNLVQGRWLHSFGTILGTWLLLGLTVNLVTTAVGGFGHGWLAQTVAQALSITLTMPFAALVGVLLFLDLRARREPMDTLA